MKRRVAFSPESLDAIAETLEWLSERSAPDALDLRRELERSLELVAEGTLSGPVRTLSDGREARRLVVRTLLVYYVATDDELHVLHVRDGRRSPIER